jgi:hypothetical protein
VALLGSEEQIEIADIALPSASETPKANEVKSDAIQLMYNTPKLSILETTLICKDGAGEMKTMATAVGTGVQFFVSHLEVYFDT